MYDDCQVATYSKEDLKDVMAACCLSTKVSAKVLFPEHFTLPFVSLHDSIFNLLDDDKCRLVAIAAPRGWGKSTLINMAYPGKKILFQEKKFIVPISCTNSQAMLHSENLKQELLQNNITNSMFGPIKSDSFSKEMWVTSSGTMILPRGAGQQVRGVKYGRNRPDLIIGDDIEDAEAVMNPELRKKLKHWWFSDVMNSINRAADDWKIVIIGTILHEDALLTNLVEGDLDKEGAINATLFDVSAERSNKFQWNTLSISLCDDQYKTNWPELMSDQDVRALADSYARKGMLDSFYREYRNKPIATENASFQGSYFQYYDESEHFLNSSPRFESVVLVDPAKTVTATADFSAVVGVSVNVLDSTIYVRDIFCARVFPDQLYDEIFAMMDRLYTNIVGIEVTSLNEFIVFPFKTLAMQRGKFIDLIKINAKREKLERIGSLIPFYRRGIVKHNKMACPILEGQLLGYPRSKFVDVADALANIVPMLDEGGRYFQPSQKDMKDEFAGLEYEEPLRVAWGVC
jgi:hypothetical protein